MFSKRSLTALLYVHFVSNIHQPITTTTITFVYA